MANEIVELVKKWRNRDWALSSEQENQLLHLLFQYGAQEDKSKVLAFVKTCVRQVQVLDADELAALPAGPGTQPSDKQIMEACEVCETCGFHCIDREIERVRKLFHAAEPAEAEKRVPVADGDR